MFICSFTLLFWDVCSPCQHFSFMFIWFILNICLLFPFSTNVANCEACYMTNMDTVMWNTNMVNNCGSWQSSGGNTFYTWEITSGVCLLCWLSSFSDVYVPSSSFFCPFFLFPSHFFLHFFLIHPLSAFIYLSYFLSKLP